MLHTLYKQIKQIIKNNLYFFVPYLIFLFAGLLAILFTEKEAINIFLNSLHNGFLDNLFIIATFLGDGLFIAAILIPFLLLFKVKYALQCSLVYSISGLIVQLIKHLTDLPRPLLYLYQKGTLESLNLYIISNIDIFYFNSFPSGHSATAFSVCLLLAFFVRKKLFVALSFLLAFIIALSRVYLLQHFFVDIYIGSMIGVLTTLIIIIIFNNWNKINATRWYNWSLGIFLKSLFIKSS